MSDQFEVEQAQQLGGNGNIGAREERHPYNNREPIPDGTSVLIVGTAPPPRFSLPRLAGQTLSQDDVDFFYGSKENCLWREFLDEIAKEIEGESLFSKTGEACVVAMRNFLRRHKMWMRDVLETYQRKKESALDNDICKPVPSDLTDFAKLFDEHAKLSVVFFTSEQAAKWTVLKLEDQCLMPKGTFAEAVCRKAMPTDAPLDDYIAVKFKAPLYDGEVAVRRGVYKRKVAFFILPTPARRSAKKGLVVARKKEIYR